jgi:hypothetical protein
VDDGEWVVESQTVYRLTQDGFYRGNPSMVNEFTILVQRGRGSTDQDCELLARRIATLLNFDRVQSSA